MNSILSIIASVLELVKLFFSKNKKAEEVTKLEERQKDINFQSTVEEIINKAESPNEQDKKDSLDSVRVLLAE